MCIIIIKIISQGAEVCLKTFRNSAVVLLHAAVGAPEAHYSQRTLQQEAAAPGPLHGACLAVTFATTSASHLPPSAPVLLAWLCPAFVRVEGNDIPCKKQETWSVSRRRATIRAPGATDEQYPLHTEFEVIVSFNRGTPEHQRPLNSIAWGAGKVSVDFSHVSIRPLQIPNKSYIRERLLKLNCSVICIFNQNTRETLKIY